MAGCRSESNLNVGGESATDINEGIPSMKRTSLWLIIAAALIIAVLFYRFRRRTNLNVEPHAGEVIEKAKRR